MNETRFGPPLAYRNTMLAHGSASLAPLRHHPYGSRRWLWIGGSLALAALVCFAVGFVRGQAEAQNHYLISMDRAEGAFQATRKGCEVAHGNDWRLCIAKALGGRWRAMAEAEVRLRNTPEAYRIQRIVDASAALLAEIEQCASLSGSRRPVCDNLALDAFRAAMQRAAGSESASSQCTLAGCPVPSTPAAQTVRRGSRV